MPHAAGYLVGLFGVVAGVLFGWLGRQRQAAKATELRTRAEELRWQQSELERNRAEALLQAREAAESQRQATDEELRSRRAELERFETRLSQKDTALEQRQVGLERRDSELGEREREVSQRAAALELAEREQAAELERIAQLNSTEARELVLKRATEAAAAETERLGRQLEDEARRTAARKAQRIVSLAIERCAVDCVTESCVSVVPLDGDELKGRIIGREGRNIRCFEQETGVDLVIDDTPAAVVISAFDPVRREIARMALEALIADGRIHPGRIEEVVARCRAQLEEMLLETGEQAATEAGVAGLSTPLLTLLGKLRFRTSYGQNVLKHSIEVSHLASLMAAELGADIRIARRAGLLHDLGKAVDSEVVGPHALVGRDTARVQGESDAVCHAIEAHHGEVEPTTDEAILVATADAMSAARPGARRDSLESYVQRLERLEEVAGAFDGVDRVYAIQAGREIRILVKPEELDDDGAKALARSIADRIESDLAYPGQIKVTVIREHRAVEYAN